jgi:hypothetical protein
LLVERRHGDLSATTHRLARLHPASQVADGRRSIERAERALVRSWSQVLLWRRERARARALRLDALSPLKTLGRGYAIVRQAETGAVIASMREAERARRLRIQFADGSVTAVTGDATARAQTTRRAHPIADVGVNQLTLPDVDDTPVAPQGACNESPATTSPGHGKAPPHE